MRALVVLLLATAMGQASAHGVWMAQRSGEMAMVYGHGAAELDLIRRFERVREVSAFDATRNVVNAGLRTMTVRVLFNGKPVAGARVIRDYVTDPDARPAITGTDGLYTFRVRNQGLNVLAASFDAPPDEPVKAAKNGLQATLTFALEHGPQ